MTASTGARRHVMLVEDDVSIGESIRAALESHGYRVTWHLDGAGTTTALEGDERPDLVLLDAGLPDVDGFTLCRWLREQQPDLPIVMVTARDSEIDIVVGLDAGADDYVTKPFATNVLLARIRAHLRQAPPDTEAPFDVGALHLEPSSYVSSIGGVPLDLRRREFELLVYLARHAGRVLSRERLLSDVWDLHWDSSTKTVDMHVVALRRKLGEAIEIVTVRGVGYRLVAP